MPTITVRIKPEDCIGSGSCIVHAEMFLRLNADDKAEVVDRAGEGAYERTMELDAQEEQSLIHAADSCPTSAITVLDASGRALAGGFAL